MASIDEKIMVFVGSGQCADLVTRLASYTDHIYAAVSPRYGEAPFPGGNITIISSYLDAAGIQRWIDRTGVSVMIDGTAEGLDEESRVIEQKARENGMDYYRLRNDFRLSRNVRICGSRDEILKGLKYSSGNILVEGPDLYRFLSEAGIDSGRLLVSAEPDAEEMRRLSDAGCPKDQIFAFGMTVHEDFWLALFDELEIRFCVLKGGYNRGIAEKAGALSHSDAAAFIDGELLGREGMTADDLWRTLSKRFGLKG